VIKAAAGCRVNNDRFYTGPGLVISLNQGSVTLWKLIKISSFIMLLALFSLFSAEFDVGGYVNGVIEGVSDSYHAAKGKAGAHEKGK
jgi:hypothetical protein